jgi:hypothetical protein
MEEYNVEYTIIVNDISMDKSRKIYALDCDDAKRIFREITGFYKEIKSITKTT